VSDGYTFKYTVVESYTPKDDSFMLVGNTDVTKDSSTVSYMGAVGFNLFSRKRFHRCGGRLLQSPFVSATFGQLKLFQLVLLNVDFEFGHRSMIWRSDNSLGLPSLR
jgi:hypothetical protein